MPRKQKQHTPEYYLMKMRNAVEKITGYSLNTEFRKKSFEYLGVRNSVEAGIAVYKLLNNPTIPQPKPQVPKVKKVKPTGVKQQKLKQLAEAGTDNEEDAIILQGNEAKKLEDYPPAPNASKRIIPDFGEDLHHMRVKRQKCKKFAEADTDNEEDATMLQDNETEKQEDYPPAPNASKRIIPDFCDYVHQRIVELQSQSFETDTDNEKDTTMLPDKEAQNLEEPGTMQDFNDYLRQSRIEMEIKRKEHIIMFTELEKISRRRKLIEKELLSMSP